MYEHIIYEPRGAVALLTLNRPERLNAWTQTMENEFIDAVNTAANDPGIGCLVVTGAGRGFCAGADIGGWDRGLKGEAPPRPSKMLLEGGSPEVPHALTRGKPAIAAINGVSVGVGLTMTLSCDIRIASSAARFSARFVRVGLTPECGSSRDCRTRCSSRSPAASSTPTRRSSGASWTASSSRTSSCRKP
jgi:2-(1,2-epoxy-1,2-dihydrophenyl)acetyl-CoA isomerase